MLPQYSDEHYPDSLRTSWVDSIRWLSRRFCQPFLFWGKANADDLIWSIIILIHINSRLWLPSKSNAPYILFAAFFGFSSGAFVSLAPALVAQISDVRQIGLRTGSMFAAISVAALVGNPIAGQLVSEEDGDYLHLQIFCGVMMLGGSCVFVLARMSLAGVSLRKKI